MTGILGGRRNLDTAAEERPCEDREAASMSRGERPREEPTLRTRGEGTQAVVVCQGATANEYNYSLL